MKFKYEILHIVLWLLGGALVVLLLCCFLQGLLELSKVLWWGA